MSMRIRWFVFLVLLSLLPQAAASPRFDVPFTLAESAQWDMQAQSNGVTYRIFVAWPDAPPPPSGYRTLYVMDGNAMFLTAVEAVRARSGERSRGGGDPAQASIVAHEVGDSATVVVAIGYPPGTDISAARAADLSPPGLSDPRIPHGTGGADRFLDFIQRELKPVIAERFQTDPEREALFGHSLGGLFVVHTLIDRPQAFQTYLAASPSLWFARHGILERIEAFARSRESSDDTASRLRLLLTAGQYEQTMDPALRDVRDAHHREADLRARAQVDNGRAVAARLDALPGIQADFVEIMGEGHASVIPSAISRGVRYKLLPFRSTSPCQGHGPCHRQGLSGPVHPR